MFPPSSKNEDQEGSAMTLRVLAAGASMAVLGLGCVEESRSLLVSPPAGPQPVVARALNPTRQAPATEQVAKRVIMVGQKVVSANPQLGLRPMFITHGNPAPEIFHKGVGALSGCQIVVTEGLARRCATDGQLAAVICGELGKIITEREALASPEQRHGESSPPPDNSIGNDIGGTFGPPDGTRQMELARIDGERQKHKHAPAPIPEVLAQQYLRRSGYPGTDWEEVQRLLREADHNCSVETGWRAAVPAPPPEKK
jgi:hypothetical protein